MKTTEIKRNAPALNYEVCFINQFGVECLRAAFVTRYDAEKYVLDHRRFDKKDRWIVRVKGDQLVNSIEFLEEAT